MSLPADTKVSQIRKTSEIDLTIPHDFSFFAPYLGYYVKQTLDIGGEAYVARTKDAVSGVFIYDDFEKTGTIFTRSKEIFDYFYQLKKPIDYVFAELKSEGVSEPYDIFTLDLAGGVVDHRFKHEITVADAKHGDELEKFMASSHPGMNRKWVKVALADGEKCFTVRLKHEIAGVGWLSVVNGVGNLHSLYVQRQYRNMGIGEDILYSRLLYLKSRRARSAFSEIAQKNRSSSRVAAKARMKVSGQIYQYFGEPVKKS